MPWLWTILSWYILQSSGFPSQRRPRHSVRLPKSDVLCKKRTFIMRKARYCYWVALETKKLRMRRMRFQLKLYLLKLVSCLLLLFYYLRLNMLWTYLLWEEPLESSLLIGASGSSLCHHVTVLILLTAKTPSGYFSYIFFNTVSLL